MIERWATRDTDRPDLCEIWTDRPFRYIRDNDYYWASTKKYTRRVTAVEFRGIFGCLPRLDRAMSFCR